MRFLLGILIFVFLPSAAFADFLSYKDDQGKTHYTDSAAKVPPQYRQDVREKVTPDRPKVEKGSPQETIKIMDDLIAENKKKQAESREKIRQYEREIEEAHEGDRRFQEQVRNKRR